MNSVPIFPPYRSCYLPAMTAAQIARLPDRAWAPVIIPTGAIEQHGPHLPVAVDSFLAQAFLGMVIPRLAPGVSCYVAPPITVGKSNEHVGFPGTLMISKDTLRQHLLTIARQVHAWGFRQIVIFNTHGGNSAVIAYTLREIRAELGLRVGSLSSNAKLDISAQEAGYGFHANEVESSWMYALAPGITHPDRAVCHYPARIEDPGELRPENAPATFSWASQDISDSGIMGDAVAGTAEKGQRWLEQCADGYAASLATLCAEGQLRAAHG
jgi:creatinine amidohydrolase